MKKYRMLVYWTQSAPIEVKAESEEEAIDKLRAEFPETPDGEFEFDVDSEVESE